MPLIPQDKLEHIKREIDLVALVRSKGIELKRHGSKDLVGLSPFTKERDPSFIVTPDKNLWHCMSSGKGGSVIDFVMHHEGVSFRHAFELLADGKTEYLMKASGPIKRATIPKLPPPVELTADEQTLLQQTIDYYHERLLQTPAALEYLNKRGINNQNALKAFRIGFADRTLGLRLPHVNRTDGEQVRERLKTIGILRTETGHEHFNGCLVFPVIGVNGKITEVYGRKIGRQNSKVYHLYLPGPHVGIWNPKCFAEPALSGAKGEVILTESIIDALTFWCHGFHNVTCIYGTEGFSDELFQAFIEHKTQVVRIAYDNDEAGNRSAERDAARLSSVGIDCYRIQFPAGMDANEYALKVTPAEKSLRVLIQSAQWLEPSHKATASRSSKDHGTQNNSTQLAANTEEQVTESSPVQQLATKDGKVDLALPQSDLSITQSGDDYAFTIGNREYRVRGLHKNNSFEVLKINLRLLCEGLFFINVLDLYHAKQRASFIAEASAETKLEPELVKRDLGKLLLKIEELQEVRINASLKPAEPEITLEQSERETALNLLKDPQLLERILSDFDRCGIVGEATNKLTGYLACVSRKLDKPLAVIVQSTSAAGKSTLMESVLSFLPPEEKVKYSAMTGQSLYYLGETELKHKVLAIVEEEGAERASYALKLLQSEGELTIASTGKDEQGRMKTEEYHVEGPVMIFLTTTAIDIDEELMNRCVVLTVDEGREQTQAIHAKQREARTFEGLKRKHASAEILNVHRNAQRLLKPLNVINPYASQLTFRSDRTRTRRDHMKYLTLIDTITLLHQHQRDLKERDGLQYIEVALSDIEAANALAHEVLGRSLDELPPQTRRFLITLQHMAEQTCKDKQMQLCDYRFTQRQIREYSGWSDFQVRKHLSRLLELEYVLCYPGRGQGRFEYELIYDGDGSSEAHLIGLIDVEMLKKQHYDAATEPLNDATEQANQISEPPTSPDRAPCEPQPSSAKKSANLDKQRAKRTSGNEAS